MGKKLTTEEFIRKSREVHNDKYDYSQVRYINNKTKVKIICPIHGVFEQRPDGHLKGIGCKKCADESYIISNDEFIKRSKKIHNNKYDYSLVEYKKSKLKVDVICNVHGVFKIRPMHHLKGMGCKKCSDERKRKFNEIIDRCDKLHNYKYDYSKIENYENKIKKVKIICPIHGEFFQRLSDHLKTNGCIHCKNPSKGEKIIIDILNNKNINYEIEKTFLDCKYINKLRFDFYLQKYNQLIEYDGEQHFENANHKDYKIIKLRDEIKNEYCKNNNIRLIRINYNENIEEKLNYYLPGLSTDPAK